MPERVFANSAIFNPPSPDPTRPQSFLPSSNHRRQNLRNRAQHQNMPDRSLSQHRRIVLVPPQIAPWMIEGHELVRGLRQPYTPTSNHEGSNENMIELSESNHALTMSKNEWRAGTLLQRVTVEDLEAARVTDPVHVDNQVGEQKQKDEKQKKTEERAEAMRQLHAIFDKGAALEVERLKIKAANAPKNAAASGGAKAQIASEIEEDEGQAMTVDLSERLAAYLDRRIAKRREERKMTEMLTEGEQMVENYAAAKEGAQGVREKAPDESMQITEVQKSGDTEPLRENAPVSMQTTDVQKSVVTESPRQKQLPLESKSTGEVGKSVSKEAPHKNVSRESSPAEEVEKLVETKAPQKKAVLNWGGSDVSSDEDNPPEGNVSHFGDRQTEGSAATKLSDLPKIEQTPPKIFEEQTLPKATERAKPAERQPSGIQTDDTSSSNDSATDEDLYFRTRRRTAVTKGHQFPGKASGGSESSFKQGMTGAASLAVAGSRVGRPPLRRSVADAMQREETVEKKGGGGGMFAGDPPEIPPIPLPSEKIPSPVEVEKKAGAGGMFGGGPLEIPHLPLQSEKIPSSVEVEKKSDGEGTLVDGPPEIPRIPLPSETIPSRVEEGSVCGSCLDVRDFNEQGNRRFRYVPPLPIASPVLPSMCSPYNMPMQSMQNFSPYGIAGGAPMQFAGSMGSGGFPGHSYPGMQFGPNAAYPLNGDAIVIGIERMRDALGSIVQLRRSLPLRDVATTMNLLESRAVNTHLEFGCDDWAQFIDLYCGAELYMEMDGRSNEVMVLPLPNRDVPPDHEGTEPEN